MGKKLKHEKCPKCQTYVYLRSKKNLIAWPEIGEPYGWFRCPSCQIIVILNVNAAPSMSLDSKAPPLPEYEASATETS